MQICLSCNVCSIVSAIPFGFSLSNASSSGCQSSYLMVGSRNRFESLGRVPFDYRECRKWAERFSEERFKIELESFVEEKYHEFIES